MYPAFVTGGPTVYSTICVTQLLGTTSFDEIWKRFLFAKLYSVL